jgi:CelD/BcsL family acetyltransferase involved in cellulose biosynthesis
LILRMNVERHHTIGPLLDEWAVLHAADDRATPYGSAAWVRAAIAHDAEAVEPWCLTARDDDGRLIGVMALARRRRAGMRVLRPFGVEHADCWDVLARPEARAAVERRLAAELRRRSGEWDALVLTHLTHASTFADALAVAGLHSRGHDALPQPHVALPATFDEYLARFPSERRRRLRKYLQPLDRGPLTVRAVEPSEITAGIARLIELRQRQWAHAGKALLPSLAEERFRRFLSAVVGELMPAGHATMVEYAVDGEPFALYLDFVDDGSFHGFMGGFEPALARFEPGKMHILASIRSSIEAGRTWANLGRGGEPYKMGFRPEPFASRTVAVTSGRLRSRAAFVAGTLAGRLR